MFAARNENGSWCLCIRRGRLIDTAFKKKLRFKSQKDAYDCAQELNKNFLSEYEKNWNREGNFIGQYRPSELIEKMTETIRKYTDV